MRDCRQPGSAAHRPGASEFRHSPVASAVSADTVVVALTAEQARSRHYSIPMLLSTVRRRLVNRRHQTRVVVELDLTSGIHRDLESSVS
jgi:hypothetical protein